MFFFEFAHIQWKNTKTKSVLTDNISVTRFFSKKKRFHRRSLERLWFCVAIRHQDSTHWRFRQHTSWLSLQTRTRNYVGDTSQNPRRHTNNTYWGDNILLGCRSWRTILPHLNRKRDCVRRTDPSTKRTIPEKTRRNRWQMRHHPHWNLMSSSSRRLTETLRRIPWTESMQMHGYD